MVKPTDAQITEAITAFAVIGLVAEVASLVLFVQYSKKDNEDWNFCILFITPEEWDSIVANNTSQFGKPSSCSFVIAGEAINIAFSLVAVVSFAASTFTMPGTSR